MGSRKFVHSMCRSFRPPRTPPAATRGATQVCAPGMQVRRSLSPDHFPLCRSLSRNGQSPCGRLPRASSSSPSARGASVSPTSTSRSTTSASSSIRRSTTSGATCVRESHQPELRRALEEGVWADGEPPAHALSIDGGIAQPDRVRIRAWAEVAGSWTVTDRRAVDALSPFYVWTPDYAEKRLAWKRRHPLHVLLLRTYRIPRPVTVKVRDDYGGCRSWLEITRDLPFEGTPVLSDEEFERASEEIAGDRRVQRGPRLRLTAGRGVRSTAVAWLETPRPRSSRAMTSATRPTPSACSRSSSTRACGSTSASPSRSASSPSCSTARPRSSTPREPWLPLQRRLTSRGRRAATSSAGPAMRALHVLAPRLLAQRASNVEGSLELLMLAPSALLARRYVAANHPGLPPPFGPRTFARWLRWAWLRGGRGAVLLRADRARPARRRAPAARAGPARVPAGPARRRAARRHVFDLLAREEGERGLRRARPRPAPRRGRRRARPRVPRPAGPAHRGGVALAPGAHGRAGRARAGSAGDRLRLRAALPRAVRRRADVHHARRVPGARRRHGDAGHRARPRRAGRSTAGLLTRSCWPSIIGTVAAGQDADRHGPVRAYLAAVARSRPGAWSRRSPAAGRRCSRAGARGLRRRRARRRHLRVGQRAPTRRSCTARMLALMSTAWVLPSLVGPALAGLIADHASWRWVFVLLLPFLPVAIALTLPGLRTLERGRATRSCTAAGCRRRWRSPAVVGGLPRRAGVREPGVVLVLGGAAGLALALPALRRLLPPGTLARGARAAVRDRRARAARRRASSAATRSCRSP